jgi:thiol-disulfide isomerase/thioredoxin
MPKLIALVLILALAASALAAPPAGVPRKSPDFAISEPLGKTTLLSSFKGKVVVLEFFFIQSDHCLRVAKMLSRLNGELGPRGFQPIGIVFDPPNARNSEGRLVQPMVDYFKLNYPVGFTSKDQVDSYLGRAGNEILNIPQVVVIDRGGVIRFTSGGKGGDPRLEDENSLRTLLNGLLQQ